MDNAGSRNTDQNHCMVSVLSIFLLSGMGIALALLAIGGVILVLPATFFFYPSWLAYSVLSLVISLMALLGGVISLPRLLKVDPITAIAE